MTTVLGWLRLRDATWSRLGPESVWFASLLAVGASAAIALNRFGGAVFDGPRAFVRLTPVGVWGWLALGAATWLVAVGIGRISSATTPNEEPNVLRTVAVVGTAHLPLFVLGLVVFGSANLLQVLGPGAVAAVFVVGFWIPAQLIVGIRVVHGLTVTSALVAVVPAYALWFLTVGQHLLGQIEHLL